MTSKVPYFNDIGFTGFIGQL